MTSSTTNCLRIGSLLCRRISLLALIAASAFPQAVQEQFEIRFAEEDVGRLCPAFEIPRRQVQSGELVSFDISILATRSISISTGVILPSGSTSSLEAIGVFRNPSLPTHLSAGSEAIGGVEWTPGLVPSGLYRFRFVAIVSTDFGDLFSICDVPIEVIAEVADEECTLINVVDGFDGDAEIDFGEVEVGTSAPGVALLEFSVPASSAAGDGQIFQCLPEGAPVAVSPGQLVGDFLAVEMTYNPTAVGDLEAEIDFYHLADADGEDLCNPVLAPQNSCVRRLRLSGRSVASVVSVEFENQGCGETLETDVVLRNETDDEIMGLSADIDLPVKISPLGAFSVRNFSLGPFGTSTAERRLRIEFPGDPKEQLGAILFVSRGGSMLLQAVVPPPPCAFAFPGVLDFGDTKVGSTAIRTVLIVNNTADDAALILSTAPEESNFVVSNSVTVGSGTVEEIEVEFRPLALGKFSGELRFTTADTTPIPDIPTVSLLGRGIQDPGLSLAFHSSGLRLTPRSALVFTDTRLSATSNRTLTVINEGEVTARGLHASSDNVNFKVVPTETFDLDPGAFRDFVLTFLPQEIGRNSGVLSIAGSNFEEQTFFLSGEAFLGQLTAVATGLGPSVLPGQMDPYPDIGLELTIPAPESLVGVLVIALDPGTLAVDPSVRFLATGPSIPFRIDEGTTIARFVGEPDPHRARYQSGTVAGLIRFTISELTTRSGKSVEINGGPEVGAIRVPLIEPVFVDSGQCRLVSDGIELSIHAVSTPREIVGVTINLTAAPDTLLSFTPPPEDFANGLFLAWFSDASHHKHGGAFKFSIPISFTDISTFGSASLRLRNSVGWSPPLTIDRSMCR